MNGAGGSGYVQSRSLNVTSGNIYNIVVGRGGKGGIQTNGSAIISGVTGGGYSSFGNLLNCEGGLRPTRSQGSDGGSGGGTSCPVEGLGSTGGSAGYPGNYACNANNGGNSQGNYNWEERLKVFKYSSLTPGEGGLFGSSSHGAGGGAGGMLLNGMGPSAQNGENPFSGVGGKGYGAGGGAGGYDKKFPSTYWAGGDGADGFAFIEWDV